METTITSRSIDSARLPIDKNEDLLQLYQAQSNIEQCPSHLVIINLIIGTLYCVKFNYEFGLVRIFKSLEPIRFKLRPQTWYHAKRCILSLLDCHCKQMFLVKDDLFEQVIEFLIQCEKYGLLMRINQETENPFTSVTSEARYLRLIVLKLIHDH